MPLPETSLQLGPWSGGVRYDVPVEEVGAHELNDMENTRLGTADQIEQRKGTLSYNSLGAVNSAATLTMAAQFNSDASTEHVFIVAGDKIYDYSSSVWTDRTGGLTVTAGDDNTFEWVSASGVMVATNGVDTNAWKVAGAANATELDDNARFSKAKHIAWFDNRLWFGNVNGATNQVWHSDIADIETYDAASFFNFGGIVTGMVPTQNALAVHTDIGIFSLMATGNAQTPYIPNQRTGITGDRGALAGIDGRSCVALPDDTQLCLLKDGVYIWEGGATLRKISGALDGPGYWDGINKDRLSQAFAGVFPRENEVWFALPSGSGQTNMNHIMVWNYLRQRWHGPYMGWERNCYALIDEKPHLGDFGGVLFDHDDASKADSGTSISALAETGGPAPLGDDRVQWLNARHYYNAQGAFNMLVTQLGADVVGTSEDLDLSGTGFTLDVDDLDSSSLLADKGQLIQDTRLQDYSTSTSLRLNLNQAGNTFSHRKIYLRYKQLGQFTKPKPVDR